jgi:outer membrane protein
MTKNPIRIAALAIALGVIAPAAHAEIKLGILDMNRVFTEYYKTKDAEKKLNDQRAAAKKEFDDRVETLKTSMDEINKLNLQIEAPELSADAKDGMLKTREEKVAEARTLDREVNDFKGTRERQLQEQFVRMRKDIIDDIMKVVTARITEGGYDLVLDKSGLSAGQIPVVVYSRDDSDFSSEIIEKLNADAPAAPAAPAASAD